MREQDLLLAREEADALRQQHGSRAEGTRHLLEAKQQEVVQLQAELERREAECGHLKQVLAEGQPQGTGREAGAAAAAVGAIEVRGSQGNLSLKPRFTQGSRSVLALLPSLLLRTDANHNSLPRPGCELVLIQPAAPVQVMEVLRLLPLFPLRTSRAGRRRQVAAYRHMPLFICFCYLCDCSRSQLILLLPTGMTFNPRRLIVLLPIGVTSYTRGG